MKKSELRNIIREEIQLLKEREMYSDNLKKLHLAINQKEYDKAMINVRKEAGWSQSDAEYMLKKYRKDLKYKGSKFYKAPPEIPKEKLKKVSWNERSYKKWIKDMSGNGGANHASDIAQNAEHEDGLIDYVKKQIKKNYGDESPLERIQWDIEMYA